MYDLNLDMGRESRKLKQKFTNRSQMETKHTKRIYTIKKDENM